MRRLTGALVCFYALIATPASAEAPDGLRFLETNLSSIANSSPAITCSPAVWPKGTSRTATET